jgi:hypothetical protein
MDLIQLKNLLPPSKLSRAVFVDASTSLQQEKTQFLTRKQSSTSEPPYV